MFLNLCLPPPNHSSSSVVADFATISVCSCIFNAPLFQLPDAREGNFITTILSTLRRCDSVFMMRQPKIRRANSIIDRVLIELIPVLYTLSLPETADGRNASGFVVVRRRFVAFRG